MRKINIIASIIIAFFVASLLLQNAYISNRLLGLSVNIGNVENFWFHEYSILGVHIKLVNLLVYTTVSFVSIMLLLLLFVLANRRRMEKREKTKENLLEEYQEKIMDYLYGKDVHFEKISRNRFKRGVLAEQIIDVSKNLPPDAKEKARKLYIDTGLIKDTVKKLNGRKWHKKIQAYKELSQLNIKDYNSEIEKNINHKNEIVRIESHIALVKLSDDEHPFSFLDSLNYRFPLWEQITLYQLMFETSLTVPNFGQWTKSTNRDVVLFCLRMIRQYNQVNNFDELDSLLEHKDDDVRKLTIQVIGDLGLFSLFKQMKKRFKYEPYENQMEIIKAFGKPPVKSVIRFLKNIVDFTDDIDMQIEAVKAIKNYGKGGDVILKRMMESDYKNYAIVIKHVLDDKIN